MTSDLVQPQAPILVICFGVSGCGKSTLAEYLSVTHQWRYVEADDYHPLENKTHMAEGNPLTDAMREPWINALCEHLKQQHHQGNNCVMAYSGLRRAHRQRFRQLGFPTLYLHLHGSKELIRQRMEERTGHYMPSTLLDSQFDALEWPDDETDVCLIEISQPIPDILEQAEQAINKFIQGLQRSV